MTNILDQTEMLRRSLKWVAAILQSAVQRQTPTFEGDVITLDGQTATVAEILDDADAVLDMKAPHSVTRHTCDVGHAHFTPFYLLSNCRRICSAEYRRKPNWVVAMDLFALGSNSAKRVCQDAGIDPDAFEVYRAGAQRDAIHGVRNG